MPIKKMDEPDIRSAAGFTATAYTIISAAFAHPTQPTYIVPPGERLDAHGVTPEEPESRRQMRINTGGRHGGGEIAASLARKSDSPVVPPPAGEAEEVASSPIGDPRRDSKFQRERFMLSRSPGEKKTRDVAATAVMPLFKVLLLVVIAFTAACGVAVFFIALQSSPSPLAKQALTWFADIGKMGFVAIIGLVTGKALK